MWTIDIFGEATDGHGGRIWLSDENGQLTICAEIQPNQRVMRYESFPAAEINAARERLARLVDWLNLSADKNRKSRKKSLEVF